MANVLQIRYKKPIRTSLRVGVMAWIRRYNYPKSKRLPRAVSAPQRYAISRKAALGASLM